MFTTDYTEDRTAGVFMIKNIALGKVFIGCSLKLRDAMNYYLSCLLNGTLRNKALQEDFNLFGKKEFEFQVIEFCLPEELKRKKEFYLRFYRSYSNGIYNVMNYRPVIQKPQSKPASRKKQKEMFYSV